MLLVGSQATHIIRFFLSRDIHVACDRAWDYTVASRGKGPDFWQPYVEEWECPPVVSESVLDTFRTALSGWIGIVLVKSMYPD
jgi:hypothetical protein